MYHTDLTFLDVLSRIASEKLEVGVHLKNGEAFLMERPTIILFPDHFTGVNWFGVIEVSISYDDIKAIDGCDIDVDVDEMGTVSAVPYPMKCWRRVPDSMPLKFSQLRRPSDLHYI